MGMGGEWELRERDDSRKYSWSYPWELWGRTPLCKTIVSISTLLKEGVGREEGEVEGVGWKVKGERLFGEGVRLMLATWMRFWLLPSRVSCVLLCPSLLLLLLLYCILLLLVDLS